jgi:hypothetical protein
MTKDEILKIIQDSAETLSDLDLVEISDLVTEIVFNRSKSYP